MVKKALSGAGTPNKAALKGLFFSNDCIGDPHNQCAVIRGCRSRQRPLLKVILLTQIN
jgi:hypothetical protein